MANAPGSIPTFRFGTTVSGFAQRPDGRFDVRLEDCGALSASIVVIANGLGTFLATDGEASLAPGPAPEWPLARTGDPSPSIQTVACHYPGELRLLLSLLP